MTLNLTSIGIGPPPGLAEIEGYVRASDAPAIVMIDRKLMLELLEYVRRLECECGSVRDDGT